MMSDVSVRSVFGKEINVSDLMGLTAGDIYGLQPSLLTVENGDPNYTYAWLVADDADTSLKLRKGMWEIVNPDNDPCIAAGAAKGDKSFRVRELILVRMPKEKYEAMKDGARARAIRREIMMDEQYKAAITQVARSLNPDSTGNPTVIKKEEVKEVKVGRVTKS